MDPQYSTELYIILEMYAMEPKMKPCSENYQEKTNINFKHRFYGTKQEVVLENWTSRIRK